MITLSGGPNGGEAYDGSDWPDGEVRELEGALYRRDGDQGVFVGMVE